MEDKELIMEMYIFTQELALDLKHNSFDKHRDKWNKLMKSCELRLNLGII